MGGELGMTENAIVPVERVERAILVIRGHKVILDADLADFYGVTVKRLNEQVKRNIERFPPDFMFQLTGEEHASLRSQIATLKAGRGQHRKFLPYTFTEHGAIMAASVLNAPKAIEMSILVVRALETTGLGLDRTSKHRIGFANADRGFA